MSQIDELLIRAGLHDDPIRFVLEHMDAQIARLELLAEREPMSQSELERITRAAAIGANAQAVAMIRSANRRDLWLTLVCWIISVTAAGLVGYSIH